MSASRVPVVLQTRAQEKKVAEERQQCVCAIPHLLSSSPVFSFPSGDSGRGHCQVLRTPGKFQADNFFSVFSHL